ncbi:MAG: hypothetical protein FJ309_05830 [Planctomycetes bacterium]|nr:hypothetical protein [Planctomycetota bacterium]
MNDPAVLVTDSKPRFVIDPHRARFLDRSGTDVRAHTRELNAVSSAIERQWLRLHPKPHLFLKPSQRKINNSAKVMPQACRCCFSNSADKRRFSGKFAANRRVLTTCPCLI